MGDEPQGVGQFDHHGDAARFGWGEPCKIGQKRPYRLNEIARAALQLGTVGGQRVAAINGRPIDSGWPWPLVEGPKRLNRLFDCSAGMLARRIG